MPKPPRWLDEDAVFEWVEQEIDQAEYDSVMEDAQREYPEDYFPFRINTPQEIAINKAVHEATTRRSIVREGQWVRARTVNLEPLVQFVLNSNLPPAIGKLVIEFLRGQRNLKTGNKPGRRKMTDDERRAINPIHDAADDVPFIKAILKNDWPNQTPEDIRDRALAITAKRHRVKEETLARYLNSSKRHRRRLSR